MVIVPGMPVVAQYFDRWVCHFGTKLRFDTRLRACFLVNARKASRVKRLCGSFQLHLKFSLA
jgi:hypothetical protein